MEAFKKKIAEIWNWIKKSKLNMSISIAGAVIFVLTITITVILITRDDEPSGNEESSKKEISNVSEETTTEPTTENAIEEEFTTEIDESETENVVNSFKDVTVKLSVNRGWDSNGETYTQYTVKLTNNTDKDIDGWAIVLNMDRKFKYVEAWNLAVNEKNQQLILLPTNSTKNIEAGASVSGGFTVKGEGNVLVDYITLYNGNNVQTIKNTNKTVPIVTTTQKESTTEEETTTEETTTEETTTEETTTEETTTEETTTEETTTKDTNSDGNSNSNDGSNSNDESNSSDESNSNDESNSSDESDSSEEDTTPENNGSAGNAD